MAYEDAGGIGTYTLSITETATPCWIPQTAGSTYPGCNEPDIIVCGKTIASCNV
jgi:hypothetical protein